MYASFQGIYPFTPTDQRYHFYPNHSPYWHNATMYKGSFGYHPIAYPEHAYFGHSQPNTNYGYGYSTHHQLGAHQSFFDEYDTKHAQYVKSKPATKKQHQTPSLINHHEYHWHHGYPFGQGSGLFPDYYHSHY